MGSREGNANKGITRYGELNVNERFLLGSEDN